MKNLQSRTKVRLFQSFLLISLSLFFLVNPAYAQGGFAVKGVIVDKTGFPLPGANVMEKGTSNGTITDLDGNFSLNVSKKGVTLTVSFMGYTPKDVVVKDKTMNITLEENAKLLDEVVVVGYGTMKKRDVTGAITSISSEAIEQKMATNVFEALQGTTAGVQVVSGSGQPGESSSIKIRGTSTFSAEGVTPLYIVDGVPLESIDGINTNDITSMEILKDAASAAIYGSRSANGVIIITTKSGQEGKARIDIKYNHSWGTLSHKVPQANRKERLLYDQYRKEYFETYGGGNPDESIDILDDPLNSFFNVDNDYLDMITSTAQKDQVDISVGGGTKKLKYFINTGYYNEKGIISNTGFQRLNTRINSDYSPTDWMNMGSRISLTYSKKKGLNEGTLLSAVLTRRPYFNTYYPDGSLVGVFNGQKNPIAQVNYTTDFTDSYKANFFQFFEIKFNKYLKFRANINANFYLDKRKKLEPSLITDEWQKQNKGYSYNYLNWNWMNEDILTYARKIKDHNFTAMVGVSAQQWRYENETFVGINSSTDFIYTMNAFAANLDLSSTGSTLSNHSMASIFARVTYDYKGRYLLNAIMRRDGSSRFGPSNRWATFPSVSAGWKINSEEFMKDVEFISLLKLRASWGMSGNDRIGYSDYVSTFTTGNVAYGNTSQIAIYPTNYANSDLKWETTKAFDFGFDLSLFKNRIQLNVDYYINRTDDLLYNLQLPAATGFNSMRTNLASIENRGWEIDLTTTNINTRSFKWSSTLNLSGNKNKVLDLGGNDEIITDAWNAQFITKVGGPISQFYTYLTDGLLTEADFEVGADGRYNPNKPLVPTVKGKKQRPGNVKYVDVDGSGSIDNDDRVAYGSNEPDVMFGFTNRFTYKDFELSIFLRGQIGGNVLWIGARNLDTGGKYGANNTLRRWLHCYKEDYPNGNPIPTELGVDMSWDGKTPTPYGLGDNSEQDGQLHRTDLEIFDATFLRIQNVSLAYNMPKKWLNALGIKAAKIYGTVENLHTFTDYVGNPDTNSYSTNPMLRGADYNTYPLSRKYIFGVNVTF